MAGLVEDASRQGPVGPVGTGRGDEHATGDAAGSGAPPILVRPRLTTVLEGRWHRRVTAVVAGAGFGKTTLLDQAVRDGSGGDGDRDAVLRIEAADANAAVLGGRVLAALGAGPNRLTDPGELVDLIVDELWSGAPAAVCIVLDDVHLLPPGGEAVGFLRDLVRRLPANAHLLFGSRHLPEIGVPRLALTGDAEVLREEDLRFTDPEVADFAAARGVDVEQVRSAEGWPALAELLARSHGVSATEYVWEEVIGPIAAPDRDRVVELAAVGRADDDLASAIAGLPVALTPLLASVPLVRRSPDGSWELHDVIAGALLEHEDPRHVADIRRRAATHVKAAGDTERAIQLLARAEACDEVIAVLREQFVQLGPQEDPLLAARWLVHLTDEQLGAPEAVLAQAVASTTTDPVRAFALGERAAEAFAARADVDGELAALALIGWVAYTLVEGSRMAPHVVRIMALAESGHPGARALEALCFGAYALLDGDWERAYELLEPLVADPERDPTLGSAAFLAARALVEGGRLQEASAVVERMPEEHRARVRFGVLGIEAAVAQGLGMDSEVLDELRVVAEARVGRRPAVARRVARCRLAFGLATGGDVEGARRHLTELELLGPTMDATRDEELLAGAALALATGDEAGAAALIAEVPDRGAFFPPLDMLVLFYVLRPDVRARYDERVLSGVHAQRRAFASALVAARAGDTAPLVHLGWPPAEVVRWFAPPTLLVEAVVRATAAGGGPPAGIPASVGPYEREVIRRLGRDAEPAVAEAARRWDATLGPVAPNRLTIRALGSLEVLVDDVAVDGPEVRRERVRALLALLVLRRSVRRSEAAATLWPDLDADAAHSNLRVTLTYLLKVLEPERDRNAPSFFVRQERDFLVLHPDPALEVDVWEFDAAVERAHRAEESGAPIAVLDALVPAVERWRGAVCEDLDGYEWLDYERLRLGSRYVRSTLRAGELLAADHELDHAELMARRCIAADAWNEAAFRLLASVHLARGDRSAARRVLEHLLRLLDDLDVHPEPATTALLARSGIVG